jgi:hypothetical protein
MKVASLLVLTISLLLDTILALQEVLMPMERHLHMVEHSLQSTDLSSHLSIKLTIMLLIRALLPRCPLTNRVPAIHPLNLDTVLSMQLLIVQHTM